MVPFENDAKAGKKSYDSIFYHSNEDNNINHP